MHTNKSTKAMTFAQCLHSAHSPQTWISSWDLNMTLSLSFNIFEINTQFCCNQLIFILLLINTSIVVKTSGFFTQNFLLFPLLYCFCGRAKGDFPEAFSEEGVLMRILKMSLRYIWKEVAGNWTDNHWRRHALQRLREDLKNIEMFLRWQWTVDTWTWFKCWISDMKY